METTATGKKTVDKARAKQHTRPAVPKEAVEADKVARQMYQSLLAPGAPKAHPLGYIMGASMVLKMLIDQAVQQGEDREALKAQAMSYIQIM